jgi:hypothetical protein
MLVERLSGCLIRIAKMTNPKVNPKGQIKRADILAVFQLDFGLCQGRDGVNWAEMGLDGLSWLQSEQAEDCAD